MVQSEDGRRGPGSTRVRERIESRQRRVVGGQGLKRGDVGMRLRCRVRRLRQQQDGAEFVRRHHRGVLIGEPQRHQRGRPGPRQAARLHGRPDAGPIGTTGMGVTRHDLRAGQAEGSRHDAARVVPGWLAGSPGNGPHRAARVQAELRGGRGAVFARGVSIQDALDGAVQA